MPNKTRSKEKTSGFASLGLADEIVSAVTALGYEEPTPVQREAIPLLIQGRDFLGQAATGTGKTAAFALPMIQRIAQDPEAHRRTSGLVLVPTRELSMQVAEAIHKYAKGFGIQVMPVYGGAPMHQQIRQLERGVAIVVATPGRALDHIRRKTLVLDDLRVLILDEADEMLDMGFAEDLDAILNATPSTRQTALFSATMPARITSIAKRHLKDPARVAIAAETTAAGEMPRVRQLVYSVSRSNKPAVLARVLDVEDPASALVFCRTRLEVETLVELLNSHGQRAMALHGGMEQRQRDHVMKLFRSGKAELLVATDVAARGLDIQQLSHVINYDVPPAAESYVHRIGRTGRAGRAGTAITLAEPRERRLLRSIENLTRQKMEIATVPTVADVRARRLDVTRASLREVLLAGKLDEVRVVVETLAQEFDIVDVAAAAVQLAHKALAGDAAADDRDIPSAAGPSFAGGADRRPASRSGPSSPRDARSRIPRGDTVRLFIGAGREAGIRPADLVGAIAGEAGIDSRSLGAIEITDRFSLIEVPAADADAIITAMRSATLRGKRVPIRRDRAER